MRHATCDMQPSVLVAGHGGGLPCCSMQRKAVTHIVHTRSTQRPPVKSERGSQHATYNMSQHATYNMSQHATCNMQHIACNAQHTPRSIHRAACNAHLSSRSAARSGPTACASSPSFTSAAPSVCCAFATVLSSCTACVSARTCASGTAQVGLRKWDCASGTAQVGLRKRDCASGTVQVGPVQAGLRQVVRWVGERAHRAGVVADGVQCASQVVVRLEESPIRRQGPLVPVCVRAFERVRAREAVIGA